MKKDLKLPHDGMALVSDGRKALFLKNEGDDVYPNFQVERVLEAESNAPAREQDGDKLLVRGERHTIEQPDKQELAERKFAAEVADVVNAAASTGDVKAIVVAAPPRTLAQLRAHFSHAVKQKILAEVNKDLTKHPVYEIEQHLTARAQER